MLRLFKADAADILCCGHIHGGLQLTVQLNLAYVKLSGNHVGVKGFLVQIGKDDVSDGCEEGFIGLFDFLAGNFLYGCLGGLAVADNLRVTAQDALYPGQQVTGVERLCDVCVYASFQGLDLGVHCRFSGEEDERDMPQAFIFTHLCPQLQTVHARHGKV